MGQNLLRASIRANIPNLTFQILRSAATDFIMPFGVSYY